MSAQNCLSDLKRKQLEKRISTVLSATLLVTARISTNLIFKNSRSVLLIFRQLLESNKPTVMAEIPEDVRPTGPDNAANWRRLPGSAECSAGTSAPRRNRSIWLVEEETKVRD